MTIPLIRMRYITIVKTKTVTVSPPLTKKSQDFFLNGLHTKVQQNKQIGMRNGSKSQ